MERIGVLINKLHEQFQQGAAPEAIAITAKMLLAEVQIMQQSTNNTSKKVSVLMPLINASEIKTITSGNPENIVGKGIEEVEKYQSKTETSVKKNGNAPKKNWMFEVVEEIPTLAHQNINKKKSTDLNETIASGDESLNDKLRVEKIEVGTALKDAPVRDMKKAIGINDRYLFINELFRGDEAMYERCIKTINSFSIFFEAEFWIKRELKSKLGWSDDSETVLHFDQLVRRRFS